MSLIRRVLAVLLPVLLLGALTACGGEAKTGYGTDEASGFDGVSVTGEFGKEPKLHWKKPIDTPKSTHTKTLIKGDGPKVGTGDKVTASVYIGNGTTTDEEWSYKSGMQGGGNTEEISAELGPVFKKLLKDATYGSRVMALANSRDVFGKQGKAEFGIGNYDAVVIVVDLKKKAYTPDTTPHEVSPSSLPSVVEKGGKVTGLDFSGVKKPKERGTLNRAVLKKGTGTTVTEDMTVKVNYLGMTYKAKKPFDESYSKKPAEFPLSNVVQGWTKGLAGLKVGSRVVLEIPPALGYGDQAQQNIPANSTLYFVVDILDAKKG